MVWLKTESNEYINTDKVVEFCVEAIPHGDGWEVVAYTDVSETVDKDMIAPHKIRMRKVKDQKIGFKWIEDYIHSCRGED